MGHLKTLFHDRLLGHAHLDQKLDHQVEGELPEPLDGDKVHHEVDGVSRVSQDVRDGHKQIHLVLLQTRLSTLGDTREVHEEDALRESEDEEDHRGHHQHQSDHHPSLFLFSDQKLLSLGLLVVAAFTHQTPSMAASLDQRFDDEDVQHGDDDEGDEEIESR